ncbi:hypothetical protein B296_00025474 [Ensete ventricosum]|uniref:Uncharacterized protein n=1 Tax=Ensete ventricosum TaxID=4639 RepID=A0A426X087_ENSVE|nr:hypothetical protein B296_00025474 [Ensete ventricosum]
MSSVGKALVQIRGQSSCMRVTLIPTLDVSTLITNIWHDLEMLVLSDLYELAVNVLVFGQSKVDRQTTLELSPCWDSLGVFKPIVSLYCISLEVDGNDVHYGSLRCSTIAEVAFRTRKPFRQVSLFPLGNVYPHACICWLCCMFFFL